MEYVLTAPKRSTKQQVREVSGLLIRCHVIELRPTKPQFEYLLRSAGTMRYVYNALVAKWQAGEKYDRKAFQAHCVAMRQSTPWMQEVTSRATYEAADNFHKAATNFFQSCKGERKGKKAKPPVFKKRGKSTPTVQYSHPTQFSINGRKLKISGMKEEIRMRENIRFKGKVKSVSIKLSAGRWFASFAVELEKEPLTKNHTAREPSVGVDFGIKSLAVLSTGEVVPNPKPLRKMLRLLKRRQRQVSRKLVKGQKQSRRYAIAQARVARLHKKVADQRAAAQHKFTTDLVKRFNKIVIEDLQVGNMLKNRKLARAIADASWASLRWRLTYKAPAAGVELVVVDKWFASSKTCSCCGHKKDKLHLSTRIFECEQCGVAMDRDVNAARNLAMYTPKGATDQGEPSTRALVLCKSSTKVVAGAFDGANINLNRGTCRNSPCEHMAAIY